MKIAYLGAGVWGYCLASLLAEKGHTVTSWSIEKDLLQHINETKSHPNLLHKKAPENLIFTDNLEHALEGAEMIVEGVTSKGIRPVFESLKKIGIPENIPIVITSKGIEQDSGLLLPDVICQVLGNDYAPFLSVLSGPSFADEVSRSLPTSVVSGSISLDTASLVADVFTTPSFRVYPNIDIRGVAIGGALKNIIAIACGISDGMKLGTGAKATLMTRGLHEMVKLSRCLSANAETLYGLSGMGDLFLTCSSTTSRNYRFGTMLAEGVGIDDAKKNIHMVVEGAYTAVSCMQLAKKHGISMPISEMVLQIIQGTVIPSDAVLLLMKRTIKEETL